MKTVNVQYFALLRDQAGRRTEAVTTPAATAEALYRELKTRHDFTPQVSALRVAINEKFADWSAPLSDGDTVVFIPPVAGG